MVHFLFQNISTKIKDIQKMLRIYIYGDYYGIQKHLSSRSRTVWL